MSEERERLREYKECKSNWKHWGPYLAERAWGTVREDYSASGEAWLSFPFAHSHLRTYRWNEDGLGGICDRNQYLCFAWSFWNGKDSILKERLFGLDNLQGNHGEDVKEQYWYLLNTPTHSFMQMRYRFPQNAFPYDQLIEENHRRGQEEREFELEDTGVFEEKRYFDLDITYAKAAEEDILIQLEISNPSEEEAKIWVLPTLWFRNTWSFGYPDGPMHDVPERPHLHATSKEAVRVTHEHLNGYHLFAEGANEWIFTENESNRQKLWGVANRGSFVKDAFHRYLIEGQKEAVNPEGRGTKCAALYALTIPAKGKKRLRLRLAPHVEKKPFEDFDAIVAKREEEAKRFYRDLQPKELSEKAKSIQKDAWSGLLWSKQLYYYDVRQWLSGDPAGPKPSDARLEGRNHSWTHIANFDVLSMPDKWEYPWYASWDLAFHCVPLARVDPEFAKRQMLLMTREWYMHPNGQIPAYEWGFSEVNPPVQAWAALKIFRIEQEERGISDWAFLSRMFTKLILNFTWWVNREDRYSRNVFEGGFLGLDNISLFDRSRDIPAGASLDQVDATTWMAFYCLNMLEMSLLLSSHWSYYQDMASKFFEHFLRIANAMTMRGGRRISLWNEEDGFFYDAIHTADGQSIPIKVRSIAGLLPLIACLTVNQETIEQNRDFVRRAAWFWKFRPIVAKGIHDYKVPGEEGRRLLSILPDDRLIRLLGRLADEEEFCSPFGIRSLSKHHGEHPFCTKIGEKVYCIDYEPDESKNRLFGGNSNWRGPIWMPLNFLLIESLLRYHRYYGDRLKVPYKGKELTLDLLAKEIAANLTSLFDEEPRLFYEHYSARTGRGLGASHQTGWTALIAELLYQFPK